MQQFLIALVSFIILLSIMVFVHEFGHFIVAKFFKVRVEAFSIGMGPRLFGYKYGETDYRICLFPIGGYVMMTGENMPGENLGAKTDDPDAKSDAKPDAKLDKTEATPAAPTQPDPGALTSKPRWQRMLIGVAGPCANFIFAFLLMLGYYWFLNEVPPFVDKPITVDLVLPGTEAAKAGIQPGDLIQSFDGKPNQTFEEVQMSAATAQNQTIPITILRNGQQIQTSLFLKSDPTKPEDFDIENLGFVAQEQPTVISVDDVIAGEPADQAGIKKNDQILSVDGHTVHSTHALLVYLQTLSGKPANIAIQRDGNTLQLVAHPIKKEATDKLGPWRLGFQAVPPPEHAKPLPLGKSITRSASFWRDNALMIFNVLGKVLSNQMSAKNLSGPIGMGQMAGEAAQAQGYYPKFYLGAAISLNLGILNLLPIPILDGGMIFILIIESIRRKDLTVNVKERIYQVAFIFLMVLFAFIIFNDLSKLDLTTKISNLFHGAKH
jgi:regulator of sigma E protease